MEAKWRVNPMDTQILNSSQIRELYETKAGEVADISEPSVTDISLLLLNLREKLSLIMMQAEVNNLDEVPVDAELSQLIYSWQGYVRNNPIRLPDPFPDYIDTSTIRRQDISDILERIDAITGVKKKEPNSRLEYIQLFDKFSDLQMQALDKLGKEENLIYEDVKQSDYLLTELSRLEAEARENGKDSIQLSDELQDKIKEFLEESWPRIKEINNLSDDRCPFDPNKNYSVMKVDDISIAKSRINLITTQLNHNLSANVRDIERITRKLGHLIDIVSHFNKEDPFIRRCVQGQITR